MLEARYPFSEQAKQGQLDLIYAYYKNRSADAAIDQADQFIRENPTHPRVDYAYYVRGLVYFESGANWLERKFKADIAKRPPHEASKSFQAFQMLVQQYPKSPYAADARQRMIFLRNRLADYEIAVARFYLKRGAYVGRPIAPRASSQATTARRPWTTHSRSWRLRTAGWRSTTWHRSRTTSAQPTQIPLPIRWPSAAPQPLGLPQQAPRATAVAADGSSEVHRRRPGNGKPPSASSLPIRATSTSTAARRPRSTAVSVSWPAPAITSPTACGSGRPSRTTARITAPTSRVTRRATRSRSNGSLDTMSLMFDAAYTFLTGPFTPYVVGGVGWAWVDTNIASAPPEVGCWWHPWWGYICTSWQDTRTVDGLAYEVGIGMRYNFSNSLAADGAYRMRWMDFENATGTPSFDTLQLNLVWKF